VSAKETEAKGSRWTNPIVVGVVLAVVGLMTNLIVTNIANRNNEKWERFRSENGLLLETLKTDPEGTCKKLQFFVNVGMFDDLKERIQKVCTQATTVKPEPPTPEQLFRKEEDMLVDIAYQRALIGNDLDVQIDAQKNPITSVVCTLDGIEVAADDLTKTPVMSFHRTFSQVGKASAGQNHELLVTVLDTEGKKKLYTRRWKDLS
jgi:hypothetical protein